MNQDQVKSLDYTLWRTSTTRFIASARIHSWHTCVQISAIAFNCYLIGFSALSFAKKIKPELESISNFSAIIIAVLLLGFGLYLQITDLKKLEQDLYKSGRKSRHLLQKIKNNPECLDYDELITEYNLVVDPLPNHSDIDNDIFIMTNYAAIPKEKAIGPCNYVMSLLNVAFLHIFPLIFTYALTVAAPILALILIGQWK